MEKFCIGLLVTVMIVLLIGMLGGLCSIPYFCWQDAKITASLYNKKFNTNYTSWEFFCSGSTIKDYLNEGKQSTYNVKLLEAN